MLLASCAMYEHKELLDEELIYDQELRHKALY